MTQNKRAKPAKKIPLAVLIAICALPVVLAGLFYVLRTDSGTMDQVEMTISKPFRSLLGMLTSIYPFSITEILIAATIVWLIYYLIKTAMATVHRRGKCKILLRRLLPVVVAAAYIWCLFCWLWSPGYYASGFADKNGFAGGSVTTENLAVVTRFFADKASEHSRLADRDEGGRIIYDRRAMFAGSVNIYRNAALLFPSLEGNLYRPKQMLFSWLMSRTGYTGMYFALTGEVNINTDPPGFHLPSTIAHEHAHQLGVFAEDEANFVSVLACVTSGNPVFEYAGYYDGLMHLLNALAFDDAESYAEIRASLPEEVMNDWRENHEFWQAQRRVETGIGFIDNILTSLTATVSDTVDTIYDGYLKSQNQVLGIRSYGACVDLLVEYFFDAT